MTLSPRRAWVEIEYNGKDITEAITDTIISFDYTERSSDEADELRLYCHDRNNKWINAWYPKLRIKDDEPGIALSGEGWSFEDSTGGFGDITFTPVINNAVPGTILKAKIRADSWNGIGQTATIDCGAFEVDGVDYEGPPDIVIIKAVSTPLASTMRRVEKSRAWENTSLQEIAEEIASDAGLSLMFEVESDIEFDRVEQLQESDMFFLQGLARQYGVSVKVTDEKIVLFEEVVYERRGIVDKFRKSDLGVRLLGYSFSQDTSESVYKVICAYKDPKSGQLVHAEYSPPQPPATRQVLMVNHRPGDLRGDNFREEESSAQGRSGGTFDTGFSSFDSTADDFDDLRVDATDKALILAQALCRDANKKEWTATITVVGNVLMVAGATIQLSEFGVYSGKYLIFEAKHSAGGGYTTTVKAHRVLGY